MIAFPIRLEATAAETRQNYLRGFDVCIGIVVSLVAYTNILILPAIIGMSAHYYGQLIQGDWDTWNMTYREAGRLMNIAITATHYIIALFAIICLFRPLCWVGIGLVAGYFLALIFIIL